MKSIKRNKNIQRSALSGKIVNGREVVMTEEAIEYVKKLGYIVKSYNQVYAKAGLLAMGFIMCFAIFLIPLISAQDALFTIDFSLIQNLVFTIIYFVVSIVLFFAHKYLFSGAMIVFGAILMVFNDINLIICMILMGVGIYITTMESKT